MTKAEIVETQNLVDETLRDLITRNKELMKMLQDELKDVIEVHDYKDDPRYVKVLSEAISDVSAHIKHICSDLSYTVVNAIDYEERSEDEQRDETACKQAEETDA